MAKKLFGGVRTQVIGTLIAAVAGLGLTACCGSCPGPQVYKKPCCAQSGGSYAPAPAPMMGAPMAPRPAAPQSNCGAGKCA